MNKRIYILVNSRGNESETNCSELESRNEGQRKREQRGDEREAWRMNGGLPSSFTARDRKKT